MTWTEHQRAILGEMGLRLWSTAGAVDARPAEALAGPSLAAPAAPADPAHAVAASGASSVQGLSPDAPRREPNVAAVPAPAAAAPRRTIPVADVSHGRADATTAGPGPVAGMGWDALAETVATCQACALCESRHQTVFGVGHRQAQWMLIGEAPGEQEDLHGEPFVGKAGQLLDNMLRAVGLTRSEAEADRQVYIANVLKCRPPHNRNPEPAEVQRCAPYLQRQIELVRPRLIVAMGRFAVQSLLDTAEPIGRLRGRVHQRQGIPVVVTYHPAYLLRNPLDKARSWEDLCLAREVWRSVSEPSAPT